MSCTWVEVNDRMQQGYRYALTAPVGQHFHADFTPDLTPAEMLAFGVFGGKYMTDCQDEFPKEWFAAARLSPRRNARLNFFGVEASQRLSLWRAKGWLHPDDPRGWFQWYCRYFLGRRLPGEDERQIGRWKAMRRHLAQLRRHCEPCDWHCRPRQRQALLQWAYDSRGLEAAVPKWREEGNSGPVRGFSGSRCRRMPIEAAPLTGVGEGPCCCARGRRS